MPSKTDDKSGQSKKASSANDNCQNLPAKRKPRRVYKESVNLNRFGCRGRVITGPDRKYFWMAFGMFIVPAIAFLAAVYVLRTALAYRGPFYQRFLPHLGRIFPIGRRTNEF